MEELTDKKPTHTERQLVTVTQAITGLLAKPTENPVKALSAVVQRGLQHNLIGGFKDAWQFLVNEGRVSEDYLNTPYGMATFQELLKSLNNDDIDEIKFNAIKNIFMNAASMTMDDKAYLLTKRLMNIAEAFTASEIVLLRQVLEHKNQDFSHQDMWMDVIKKTSGLKHKDLVNADLMALQSKMMIKGVDSPFPPTLTSLGREMSIFMLDPTTKA